MAGCSAGSVSHNKATGQDALDGDVNMSSANFIKFDLYIGVQLWILNQHWTHLMNV